MSIPTARRVRPAGERFWEKVAKGDEGCWGWLGRLTTSGYGVFQIGNRRLQAHRYGYELVIGPIADGLQLDHLCRNRACVNPAHLEPVTATENKLRGESPPAVNARKTHCINGHEFTPANTWLRRNGRRTCRECSLASGRRHWARHRSLTHTQSSPKGGTDGEAK